MRSGERKVVSTKDTISSLLGGRSCSAAMTGESSVPEVKLVRTPSKPEE